MTCGVTMMNRIRNKDIRESLGTMNTVKKIKNIEFDYDMSSGKNNNEIVMHIGGPRVNRR